MRELRQFDGNIVLRFGWKLAINRICGILMETVYDSFLGYVCTFKYVILSLVVIILDKFVLTFRNFLVLPHTSVCFGASISSYSCRSTIPLSSILWLWFGLERGDYLSLVWPTRSCSIVTITVRQGKFL